MANRALNTVQDVVNDYIEVADAVNTILNEKVITANDLKALEVKPFGSRRWLIVLTYLTNQAFSLTREFSNLVGLNPTMALLVEKLNTKKPRLGIVLKLETLMRKNRAKSTRLGLLPTRVFAFAKPATKFLVGLRLSLNAHMPTSTRATTFRVGLSQVRHAVATINTIEITWE